MQSMFPELSSNSRPKFEIARECSGRLTTDLTCSISNIRRPSLDWTSRNLDAGPAVEIQILVGDGDGVAHKLIRRNALSWIHRSRSLLNMVRAENTFDMCCPLSINTHSFAQVTGSGMKTADVMLQELISRMRMVFSGHMTIKGPPCRP